MKSSVSERPGDGCFSLPWFCVSETRVSVFEQQLGVRRLLDPTELRSASDRYRMGDDTKQTDRGSVSSI